MRAWHRGTFAELLDRDPTVIAAELAAAAASRRLSPNPESMGSWVASAAILKDVAQFFALNAPHALAWSYFLEFEVPRRSRRIDAVIIADDVIFLVEWKVGAERFDRAALWQAEQYALDMRDFHEGSRGRTICPILIATEAPERHDVVVRSTSLVQSVRPVTPSHLPATLIELWEAHRRPGVTPIDALAWEESEYRPTPNIVEAARLLYEHHDVRAISLSGAQNLDHAVGAVLDLIALCRRDQRRGIAFITGAPGSGKTLAGLQVVHAPEVLGDEDARGVFLSGNMPLVEVISAALADSLVRSGRPRGEAAREVRTFIQHAYAFRNEYAEHPLRVPSEHVVLFDEAQRAWDAKQVAAWTKGASHRSEPEILLDVMNRVSDWAVVIAMVGSGQEINTGEAGLSEWGRSLRESHPDWLVRASPAVLPDAPEPPGGRLFDIPPSAGPAIETDLRLHLQMNVRSPRAERLNQWVDALLRLDTTGARVASPDPAEYPMVLTRSLDVARTWLRDRSDASERTGLLASADARRLQAWGLDTRVLKRERAWADWFLKERGDVRGSDQLEIVATNFDCQGLELDWAAVCWGNDLTLEAGLLQEWKARRFVGSRWTNANDERARFILNGYRVILTRARRGQVIWVPQPNGTDATLDPVEFDRVAELLQSIGVPSID